MKRFPLGAWLVSAALALPLGATSASAQLRPLEPIPVEAFAPGARLSFTAGVGRLEGQRASLAGTSGTLVEAGKFVGAWRDRRFAIELAGTVRRSFEDRERFAEPLPAVRATGPDRGDSGDYRVGAIVQLTPLERPAALLLRFGTRLPNSDDEEGIDRDRTDFYALVAGRLARGPLLLAGEAGIGIHGTHDLQYEQADPLLYSLTAEYALGPAALRGAFLGQRSGFGGWVQRGNESLSELRAGVRVGERYGIQLLHVVGLAEFSPRRGWLLTASARR